LAQLELSWATAHADRLQSGANGLNLVVRQSLGWDSGLGRQSLGAHRPQHRLPGRSQVRAVEGEGLCCAN
jgi:hypothetical protein